MPSGFVNWELSRGAVILGDNTSNWWDLIRWANQHSYSRPCFIVPGTYLCSATEAPVQLVSGVVLIGNPGVTVVSSMASTGTQTNCPISSYPTQQAAVAPTLSSNNIYGSRTLSINGNTYSIGSTIYPIVAGTEFFIGSAATGTFQGQNYVVQSITGTGPYTVTVERPILITLLTGDVFLPQKPPTDIRVLGNGMQISGTGDRAVQIRGAYRCVIEDVRVTETYGHFSDTGMSFDIGNRQSYFNRCRVDMGNQAGAFGIMIETGENSHITECTAEDCSASGYSLAIFDGINCSVRNCYGFGSGTGLGLVADANTIGCTGCLIVGGGYEGNTNGVVIQGGSTGTKIDGVDANYNTAAGINIGGADTAKDTVLVDCRANGNVNGVVNTVGSTGTRARNLTTNDNSNIGVNLVEAMNIDGFVARRNTGGAFYYQNNAADIRVTSFEIEAPTGGGAWVACTVNQANSRVVFAKGIVTIKVASSVVFNHGGAGSVWTLEDVAIINQGSVGTVTGYNGGAGCVLRRKGRVDFDTVATPFATSGTKNFGTLTLNGATPVDFSFTDMKTTDPVMLTRKTAGGTPANFTYTVTAASKISVTGTAGDTSVIDVEIG